MTVLYNEFDKNAAAWLRELISMGAIADGYVDQRSILELTPSDIGKYRCAHFFAGIGGWSYALRLAGIPDDYPVWTASLPCQPFSLAGKGLGKNDERHLLPHFLELVKECRPQVIFGEQVENAIRSTGLRTEIKDLQSLQSRKAYIEVLAELQRQGGKALYELQRMGEEQQEEKEGENIGRIQGMAGEESRVRFSKCCASQGERERAGIRYHREFCAGEDRRRSLRSDRNPIRLEYPESLECSIIGQDRQQPWVSEEQYESCYICAECNDEHMGGAENFGSIEWNHESAQEQIARANREADESLEGSHTRGWLDDLQANLEAEGYSVGYCVLGAHSVGAPHIRQRLYWVAYSESGGRNQKPTLPDRSDQRTGEDWECGGFNNRVDVGRVSDSGGTGLQEQHGIGRISPSENGNDEGQDATGSFGMGDTAVYGYSPYSLRKTVEQSKNESRLLQFERPDSHWSDCDWLYCRDGKYRPIKSGLAPLVGKFKPSSIEMADGLPRGMVHSGDSSIAPDETAEARAMRLKGYGNAIVPQTAAEFIKAVFEALDLY